MFIEILREVKEMMLRNDRRTTTMMAYLKVHSNGIPLVAHNEIASSFFISLYILQVSNKFVTLVFCYPDWSVTIVWTLTPSMVSLFCLNSSAILCCDLLK